MKAAVVTVQSVESGGESVPGEAVVSGLPSELRVLGAQLGEAVVVMPLLGRVPSSGLERAWLAVYACQLHQIEPISIWWTDERVEVHANADQLAELLADPDLVDPARVERQDHGDQADRHYPIELAVVLGGVRFFAIYTRERAAELLGSSS